MLTVASQRTVVITTTTTKTGEHSANSNCCFTCHYHQHPSTEISAQGINWKFQREKSDASLKSHLGLRVPACLIVFQCLRDEVISNASIDLMLIHTLAPIGGMNSPVSMSCPDTQKQKCAIFLDPFNSFPILPQT